MNKLRLTYTKAKASTFLTHKEQLKVLERALVRAGVNLVYDKDKKAKMTSAIPLFYGMESTSEICDVLIEESIDTVFVVRSLNKMLPVGMVLMSAECINDDDDICISDRVYAVTYEIIPEFANIEKMTHKQYEDLKTWYKNTLRWYLEEPMVLVLLKLPERNERIDIKKDILEYEIMINSSLRITVITNKNYIFNPNCIMDGLIEQTDRTLNYSIKRIKILYK